MDVFDVFAQQNGFKNKQEMVNMIAAIDLSVSGALEAFNEWKEKDGSKTGLIKLFPDIEKK